MITFISDTFQHVSGTEKGMRYRFFPFFFYFLPFTPPVCAVPAVDTPDPIPGRAVGVRPLDPVELFFVRILYTVDSLVS